MEFWAGFVAGGSISGCVGFFFGLGLVALSRFRKRNKIAALEAVADAAECFRLQRFEGDADECWKYLENSLRDLRTINGEE